MSEGVSDGVSDRVSEGLDDGVKHAMPDESSAGGHAAPIALVEVLDRDGRARQVVPVSGWPLTIGRAIDNDVVLDDPHVAAYHAVVEAASADGMPQLRVLPGKNGMQAGRQRLAAGGAPMALSRLSSASGPAELSAGHTRLRLRLAGETLEPERELPRSNWATQASTLAIALVLWLWILAEQAIVLDPGSKAADWLPPLVGAPLAVTGWCLMWGLASKIFQHRFEFWPHVAVAVRGLLAMEVASAALLWASGLTGWPGFARLVTGASVAIALVTVWCHARLVLPHQQRALGWAAGVAYVAGAAILLGLNQQRSERWFAELYSHMLPPPALMWQTPTPRDAFVARAERLKPALDKSAAEAAAEQKEKGDDEEE